MNLRLRLVNGQMIVIENVSVWDMKDTGLYITDTSHKHFWYNRTVIATLEEENQEVKSSAS